MRTRTPGGVGGARPATVAPIPIAPGSDAFRRAFRARPKASQPLSLLQSVAVDDAAGLRKLYDTIAARARVDAPAIDFAAAAAQLKPLQGPSAAIDRIREPRILCASSLQYAEPAYGFEHDIAALQAAFPGRVTVDAALTTKRLRALLTGQGFDIVHLVLPVHPRTGELVFSGVDPRSNLPVPGPADAMPLAAFVRLLVEAKVRLVVLATCLVPLVVAQEVQRVAHVAASDDDIRGEQVREWAECFYGLLAQGRSVHQAFDLTKTQVEVPMRSFEAARDVAFAAAPP